MSDILFGEKKGIFRLHSSLAVCRRRNVVELVCVSLSFGYACPCVVDAILAVVFVDVMLNRFALAS